MYRDLLCCLRKSLFYSRLGERRHLPPPPPFMHAPHAYRRLGSSSGIRCHAGHSLYQHGLGISFQRRFFFVLDCASYPPRQIGFVRLSSVIPHIPWSRHMFWVFNIRVDLAPQRDKHRLGFTLRVCTYGRWPTVLHAYVSPILVLGGVAGG